MWGRTLRVKKYEVVWLHVFPVGYRLDIVHCTGLTGLTVNCEWVVLVTVQGPGLGGGWRDITRYSHAAACNTDSSGQQLYSGPEQRRGERRQPLNYLFPCPDFKVNQ